MWRRAEYSQVFQKWFLFSSLSGDWEVFFLCENNVELQEIKLTKVWKSSDNWVTPVIFNLLDLSTLSSSNSSVTVQISLPQHWFSQRFLSRVSALVSYNPLYLPVGVFNSGGNKLLRDLSSLWDLRGVVDFTVFQLFLVRVEWQFQSFLYAELETRSTGLSLIWV